MPPLALVTSVSDFAFLWRFWRWTLNRLCYADLQRLPYYAWVGNIALQDDGARRSPGAGTDACPSTVEEALGHTSKALSLHALVSLRVAERVLFVDTDIWIDSKAFDDAMLFERLASFVRDAGDAMVALPAPCYKQFFGVAQGRHLRGDACSPCSRGSCDLSPRGVCKVSTLSERGATREMERDGELVLESSARRRVDTVLLRRSEIATDSDE